MWDAIIVGAIVLAAAGYAVYRLFARRSCGCGCGTVKSPRNLGSSQTGSCSCGHSTGCSCGK